MKISNQHTEVEIQSLGAMIKLLQFKLPNGSTVEPLFTAPWSNDIDCDFDNLSPIIQYLAGEWPCVPFGGPGNPDNLPSNWKPVITEDWDGYPHGYSSNHDWRISKPAANHLVAEISYPANSPIDKLERHIRLDPAKPAIDLELVIYTKNEVQLPVGLHPVFDLKNCITGDCHLDISSETRFWSLPVELEPGKSLFALGQENKPLEQLLSFEGKAIDALSIPLQQTGEDLLMLTNTKGNVGLVYPKKNYRIDLYWDTDLLPNCILWYSNGGRMNYPWLGRINALGIEPVVSAFDFGLGYSLSKETPLAKNDIPTYLQFEANSKKSIKSRIDLSLI